MEGIYFDYKLRLLASWHMVYIPEGYGDNGRVPERVFIVLTKMISMEVMEWHRKLD